MLCSWRGSCRKFSLPPHRVSYPVKTDNVTSISGRLSILIVTEMELITIMDPGITEPCVMTEWHPVGASIWGCDGASFKRYENQYITVYTCTYSNQVTRCCPFSSSSSPSSPIPEFRHLSASSPSSRTSSPSSRTFSPSSSFCRLRESQAPHYHH